MSQADESVYHAGLHDELMDQSSNDESDSPIDDDRNMLSKNIINGIDHTCLLEMKNDSPQNISRSIKESCKIMKFGAEWNYSDILKFISHLDLNDFPKLFIFVIEINYLNKSTKINQLEETINKIFTSRPLIIQITSQDERITKFYYTLENSDQLLDMDHDKHDFSLILEKLLSNKDGVVDKIVENITSYEQSGLIIRLLKIFNLTEEQREKLIFYCAKSGTVNDLLSALDYQFHHEITSLYFDSRISNTFANSITQNTTKNDCNKEENEDEYASASILHTAVINKNAEIIDYLITYGTHLIQELSFDHQVLVSTIAFNTNQLDVLCDLINIADFPFPKKFISQNVIHQKLKTIMKERSDFHDSIKNENLIEIKKFIDHNRCLKYAYNTDNTTAMETAYIASNFESLYLLKTSGYGFSNYWNTDELLKYKKCEEDILQIKRNKKETTDENELINLLCNKSIIHNRKIKKNLESEYRMNIRKWFEDINKVNYCSTLLKVAASCEDLKIIFDFQNKSVENIHLGASSSSTNDFKSKFIFIGASVDNNRYQKVQGIIIHELCHYVMQLVYENEGNPYYKHRKDKEKIFEEIVHAIDKWSKNKCSDLNDECNGIISSVFKHYDAENFHRELIVRVIQILVMYDNDKEKIIYLQNKYHQLFDYWIHNMFPELNNFNLKSRNEIRNMNRIFGITNELKYDKIELKTLKEVDKLMTHTFTIVTTNIPKLLLLNIYKHLENKLSNLLDTKNVFVNLEMLQNTDKLKDFLCALNETRGLNIFIVCSDMNNMKLDNFNLNAISSMCFITPNSKHCDVIKQNFPNVNLTQMELNFNWNDLSEDSKEKLLKTKVNFQNNSETCLYDLITKNEEMRVENTDFCEIIDDLFLNTLLSKNDIKINEVINATKEFTLLYQQRKFISSRTKSQLSEEELISKVKNDKFILISDIAGNGKSWAMKSIAKKFMSKLSPCWVSYIDLKQFIKDFNPQQIHKHQTIFTALMDKNILNFKNNIEFKIFKKMYEMGKVVLLFDGFDEMPADLFIRLAQTFERNDGNQLWIATRDYFKNKLQEELQIESTYKLNEFSIQNGAEFIAKSWMLNEVYIQEIIESKSKFKKFQNYLKRAQKIAKKVNFRHRTIGLPLLYKMIAESSKCNEQVELNISEFKVFEKMVNRFHEKWSSQKGELKKSSEKKLYSFEMDFNKFHQYLAIKSLFPVEAQIFFSSYGNSKWTDKEVIETGMIYEVENYLFNHETFREYYIADFIAKELKNQNYSENFRKLVERVLIVKKFNVIRMFLNDMIKSSGDFTEELTKLNSSYAKMENLHDIFHHKLSNLIDIIFNALEHEKYENVREFLYKNYLKAIRKTKNLKYYMQLQDFLFNRLKRDDLKSFIKNQEILQNLFLSQLNSEVIEIFISKIDQKFGKEFIKEIVNIKSKLCDQGNIFHLACWSDKMRFLKSCLIILEKYFSNDEKIEIVQQLNQNSETILHICIQKGEIEKLKLVWEEVKKIFHDANYYENHFKIFVTKISTSKQNILHYGAFVDDLRLHKILWSLLDKIFKSENELKDFLLQKDVDDFTSLHYIIKLCNVDIIEYTFEKLKEILNFEHYRECLMSTDFNGRNLLHTALIKNELKTFKILWGILQNSCKTYEDFFNLLLKEDRNSDNIFHLAALFASYEIISFLLTEIEKFTSSNQIREFLRSNGMLDRNITQSAAAFNKCIKCHEYLWNILKKYFTLNEIMNFITHVDETGENLILTSARQNSKEVVQFLWNIITKFCNDQQQNQILRIKTLRNEDILKISEDNKPVYEFIVGLLSIYDTTKKHSNISTDTDDSEHENNIKDFIRLKDFVISNDYRKVRKFLKFTRVDINCLDKKYFSSIDYAWINYISPGRTKEEILITEKIMILLLVENSKFPNRRVDFEFDTESEDVKDFIDFTDQLNTLIKQYPNLTYFLERNNKNILLCALRMQRLIVLNKINPQNVFKMSEMHVDGDDFDDIKKIYQPHILMILLKSSIIGDMKNTLKWNIVVKALDQINKIKSCSIILKVVATCQDVKIIFNFDRSLECSKFILHSKKIEIGMYELKTMDRMFEMYGVIIHEFCHAAVCITFMNGLNPFPVGPSELKDKYNRILKEIKLRYSEKRKMDKIVTKVFELYQEDQYHAELIVTVVQIVMQYYRDFAKINQNQQHLKDLFEYFTSLIPEFEKTISVLKLIQNRRYAINYNILTDSMKSKIMHSTVKFQNHETTFAEMVGNCEDIFKMLTSDEIRKILQNYNIEIVKSSFISNVSYNEYVRRTFAKQNVHTHEDKFIDNVSNQRFFILSDNPGAGKTTTFEYLSSKLKEKYKYSWVCFFSLRNFVHNNPDFFENNNPENIFINMMNISNKLEINIFKKMYEKGKIFFLFDGFDEICPKHSNVFVKLLKNLRINTENKILISTRQFNINILTSALETDYYTFVPFTKHERSLIVKNISKRSDNDILEEFFEYIESKADDLEYNINNPLMIKVLSELFAQNEVEFSVDNINTYNIFVKMMEKLKENWFIKIPLEDSLARTKITSEEMHRAKAVETLLIYAKNQNFIDELNNTAIIKNWKRDLSNWTDNKTQRYGFILCEDEKPISFTHKTFADYFLSDYLISGLYDNSYMLDECRKLFNILRYIGSSNNFRLIQNILLDYSKMHSYKELTYNIKSLIQENISQILQDIQYSTNCSESLIFWVGFFPDDCMHIVDMLYNQTGSDSIQNSLSNEIGKVIRHLKENALSNKSF